MNVELIRLVMLPRQDLLTRRRQKTGLPPSREEWLRSVFSKKIVFQHRGTQFYILPAPEGEGEKPYITLNLGRQLTVKEHEPPDQGLVTTHREQWQAIKVVIDPTHHEDGQKAAVEIDPRIGKPLPLFQSLADYLNNLDPPEDYLLEANGITDPANFQEFVKANPGDITSVTFELIPPNMFGIRDDIDEEMKSARDVEKAQKVILSLESKEGLQLDTKSINQAANYASEGGGSIVAKTKKGKKFNSKNNIKHVKIDTLSADVPDDEGMFKRIIRRVFSL